MRRQTLHKRRHGQMKSGTATYAVLPLLLLSCRRHRWPTVPSSRHSAPQRFGLPRHNRAAQRTVEEWENEPSVGRSCPCSHATQGGSSHESGMEERPPDGLSDWAPMGCARNCPFFCGRRPLPFGGSHLRLPSGPAGIRTTTGSLSALARPTPYQLSHRVAWCARNCPTLNTMKGSRIYMSSTMAISISSPPFFVSFLSLVANALSPSTNAFRSLDQLARVNTAGCVVASHVLHQFRRLLLEHGGMQHSTSSVPLSVPEWPAWQFLTSHPNSLSTGSLCRSYAPSMLTRTI